MPFNKIKNYKLLLFGLLSHLILFYSIFDIYFKSPLVHGMTPHASSTTSPAKRLVLFVADGLRADKFFELDENGKNRAPYLREIIKNVGAWGVSHTHVPTESRPGHVALIAGFYEDVSAVAKGWKENPVEFDSVFNESQFTWSWGSPDILPMFAKGVWRNHVDTFMYAPEKVDFGSMDSSRLDSWVFQKVEEFFSNAYQNETLMRQLKQDRIIFFLHLLGIDTNGHSHKPNSQEYLQNIRIVDEGIKRIVNLLEKFYDNDKQTSFIFTSDHGMTNWGSHGAGDPHETMTPLVAWGAGIRGPKLTLEETNQPFDGLSKEWHLDRLWRTDVEQADVAPLMASLIGIPFPMNSVGNLPIDYLNGNLAFKAENLFTNVQQVLAQYQVKMYEVQNKSLSLTFHPFDELTPAKQVYIQQHITRLLHAGQFGDAISECQRVLLLALQGLRYYQTYDRFFLGCSVVLSFIGWIGHVSSLLLQEHSGLIMKKSALKMVSLFSCHKNSFIKIFFAILSFVTILFLYLTSSPLMYYIYCLQPVILWMNISLKKDIFLTAIKYASSSGHLVPVLLRILGVTVGLEILVFGFFFRKMISFGLLLMAFWAPLTFDWKTNKAMIFGWIFSCFFLAVFPLLPVVNRDTNYNLVYLSGALAILLGFFCLFRTSREKKNFGTRKLEMIQIFLVILSVFVVWSTTKSLSLGKGLPQINQFISWLLLGLCFILPLFSRLRVIDRLLSLSLSFIATFLLTSISYECLFLLSLCCLLFFWIQLECQAISSTCLVPIKFENLSFDSPSLPEKGISNISREDIRRAFFFIFLIFTAFFGTGNIASINSFDPSSVYCFVTQFNPFVMGSLLLFKVCLPFVFVTSAFTTLHLITKTPKRIFFMIVLIISDVMAIQFFSFVRDSGSWLEIGTSISHYVIVMSMIIFLFLLEIITHGLTSVQIQTFFSSQN